MARLGKSVRRVLKWSFRLTLVLVLLVVLVVGATLFWASETKGGRAFVLAQIEQILEKSVLAGDLQIGALEQVRGRIVLSDVRLLDVDGVPILAADTVEATYRLLPLLSSEVIIPSLRIEGADVTARVGLDGSLNLATMIQPSDPNKPPSTAPPWAVNLERIEVVSSRASLRDARNDDARLVLAHDLNALVRVDVLVSGDVEIGLNHVEAQVATPIDFESFTGLRIDDTDVVLGDEEITIDSGALGVGATLLSGLGARVDLSGDGPFAYLDVDIPELVARPEDVNPYLGGVALLEPLTLGASIEGPANAVVVSLPVEGPDGRVDASLTFDLTDMAEPGYRGEIRLTRFVPSRWVDIDVDADVSMGVYLRGRGFNPQTMHVGARLDVGPSSVLGFRVDAAHVVARYDAGDIAIRRLAVWSGAAAVDLAATLTQAGAVTASLDVDIPDLAELAPRFPDTVPEMSGSVDVLLSAEGSLPLDEIRENGAPTTLEGWLALGANMTADVELAADRFVGLDAEAERVRLTGQVRGNGDLPDIEVDASVREVRVAGVRIDSANTAATFDGERLSAQGAVSLEHGAQTAEFDIVGRLRDDEAVLDIRSLNARASGYDVRTLSSTRLTIDLDDGMMPVAFSLTETEIEGVGVNARVSGSFDLRRGAMDARIVATNVDLLPLGERFAPEVGLTGFANIRASAGGTLSSPTATLQAETVGVSAVGLPAHGINVDLAYDAQALTGSVLLKRRGALIGTLYLGPAGIPLDVNLERGRFALAEDRPISLDMTVERLKLDTLGALLPETIQVATRGYLAADLGVRGTISSPEMIGSVRLSDGTIDLPIEAGEWRISNANVDVNVQAAGVGDDWTVSMTSDVALGSREIVDLDVDTTFSLSEALEDPAAELMRVDLETNGTLYELTVEDLPEWLREDLSLSEGAIGGALSWSGSVSTGAGAASLFVSGLQLDAYEPVTARIDFGSAERVTLNAVAFYGADAPEVQRTGTIPAADAHTAGMSVHASVGASLADLMGEGASPVAAPLEIRILLPRTEVQEFGSVTEQLVDQAGTIGGYIDMFGTAGSPTVRGRVALRDVALLGGGLGAAAVELAYEDGEVTVDGFACDGLERGVGLQLLSRVRLGVEEIREGLPAWTDWPLEGRLFADNVALETVVPQLVVATLVDALSGRLDADVALNGTAGQPQLRGHLELDDVRMSVIPLARTFESVSMTLDMTEEAITLTELDINDERGRVRGTGAVQLESFEPRAFELSIRSQDFLASAPSGLGAFLSGEVTLAGDIVDNRVTADVSLADLQVEVPDDVGGAGGGPRELPSWVYFEGEDVAADQRGERTPTPLFTEVVEADANPFRASVRVRTDGRGVVRHSVGDVYFTADLNIELDDELRIGGAVLIPEGTLRVAGKDFALEQGRIAFTPGQTEVDPSIDIEAVHLLPADVTDYLAEQGQTSGGERASVSVVVRGNLSDLARDPENAVRLVSDPRGLSESDIFQLLATGHLSGDTGDEQQGVAAIGSLLLGLVGDSLSGGVPIDTIRIESTSESQRIEGGKYIADNVYVSGTYIRSPDDEDDNNFEVALEWVLRQIGPGSLRLELRGGDRAKGGLELLYNLITR